MIFVKSLTPRPLIRDEKFKCNINLVPKSQQKKKSFRYIESRAKSQTGLGYIIFIDLNGMGWSLGYKCRLTL